MANVLGNGVFNPQYWAREMQQIFFKENRAIALANTELRELLNDGDVVHKPYRSHLIAQTYTKGSDITVQDVSGADETLTVDTAKVVPFYIDDIKYLCLWLATVIKNLAICWKIPRAESCKA